MKKIILFGKVAIFALSFSSFKKEYTCTCTDGNYPFAISYPKASKKQAEDACKAQQTKFQVDEPSVTCTL